MKSFLGILLLRGAFFERRGESHKASVIPAAPVASRDERRNQDASTRRLGLKSLGGHPGLRDGPVRWAESWRRRGCPDKCARKTRQVLAAIAPFRIFLRASRFRHTRGEQAGGQITGNVMSQYRNLCGDSGCRTIIFLRRLRNQSAYD